MPRTFKDITGNKFNHLTAIKQAGYYLNKNTQKKCAKWLWQCDCGKQIEDLAKHVAIKKPRKISCGCMNIRRKYFGSKSTAYGIYKKEYNDGDITFEQFYEMSQKQCYWCDKFNFSSRKHPTKKDIFFQYHGLDRIDNTRGHYLDNVVTCCWPCNNIRGNSTVEEFMTHIQEIYLNRIGEWK